MQRCDVCFFKEMTSQHKQFPRILGWVKNLLPMISPYETINKHRHFPRIGIAHSEVISLKMNRTSPPKGNVFSVVGSATPS